MRKSSFFNRKSIKSILLEDLRGEAVVAVRLWAVAAFKCINEDFPIENEESSIENEEFSVENEAILQWKTHPN